MPEATTPITVGGMSCGGCASSVKKALERVPGVVEATVSFEQSRADVNAPGVDRDQLVQAIVKAGFEAS
jgi:copper chaperone CopZ